MLPWKLLYFLRKISHFHGSVLAFINVNMCCFHEKKNHCVICFAAMEACLLLWSQPPTWLVGICQVLWRGNYISAPCGWEQGTKGEGPAAGSRYYLLEEDETGGITRRDACFSFPHNFHGSTVTYIQLLLYMFPLKLMKASIIIIGRFGAIYCLLRISTYVEINTSSQERLFTPMEAKFTSVWKYTSRILLPWKFFHVHMEACFTPVETSIEANAKIMWEIASVCR